MRRLATAVAFLLLTACGDAELYVEQEEFDDLSDHGGGDLADDELAEFGQLLATAPVVVNECKTGSTGGFIELYNPHDQTVDLFEDPTSCYWVDDKQGGAAARLITDTNVHHVAGSTTCSSVGRPTRCARVAPKERVWLSVSFIDTANVDACRLLKSPFTSGACSTTTSDLAVGGAVLGAGAGLCYGRAPDGADWAQRKLETCTPGTANPSRTLCSGTSGWAGTTCNDGNACTVGERWSATCVCGAGQAVSCVAADEVCKVGYCSATSGCSASNKADGTSCATSAGAVGACSNGTCVASPQGPPLVINEFMGGSSGWVEIYNTSSVELEMEGWKVDDIEGGSSPKIIPSNNQIAPYGRMLVYFAGINVSSADTVRLISPQGALVDAHGNYYAGASISGRCFGRMPNGGAWAQGSLSTCTPAGHNPIPRCAGGTYGGVTFTDAEACKTIDYLNRAPYSTLGGTAASTTAYDCAPDGTCGPRRSAWNTLRELEDFGGGSCAATAFGAWKSAASAWVDDGRRTDKVAWVWANRSALRGEFVALERVYVASAPPPQGDKHCAEVRDSSTSSGFMTVCDYPGTYTSWSSKVGKHIWVRGYVTWDPNVQGGRWVVQESRNGVATASAVCGTQAFFREVP